MLKKYRPHIVYDGTVIFLLISPLSRSFPEQVGYFSSVVESPATIC